RMSSTSHTGAVLNGGQQGMSSNGVGRFVTALSVDSGIVSINSVLLCCIGCCICWALLKGNFSRIALLKRGGPIPDPGFAIPLNASLERAWCRDHEKSTFCLWVAKCGFFVVRGGAGVLC